jgi:hypothetical protein
LSSPSQQISSCSSLHKLIDTRKKKRDNEDGTNKEKKTKNDERQHKGKGKKGLQLKKGRLLEIDKKTKEKI